MAILDFEKPKKVRTTEEHNKMFSSEAQAAGSYVQNMSDADKEKWKAKHIQRGDDPRVEIRKTVGFSNGKGWGEKGNFNSWAQLVIIVRPKSCVDYPQVLISANGKIAMSTQIYVEMQQAIDEAMNLLDV